MPPYACGMETFDAIPTPKANVQRGLTTLARCSREKTTLHRTMCREGLGWVYFVYFDEGAAHIDSKALRL